MDGDEATTVIRYIALLAALLIVVVYFVGFSTEAGSVIGALQQLVYSLTGRTAAGEFVQPASIERAGQAGLSAISTPPSGRSDPGELAGGGGEGNWQGPTQIPAAFEQSSHKVYLNRQQLSLGQLVRLAKQAGFQGEDAAIAGAIARWESNGYITHYNPESNATGTPGDIGRRADVAQGTGSWGLWQIFAHANPELLTRYNLLDPLGNAKAAYALWLKAGHSFRPWSAFNGYLQSRPGYLLFLGEARRYV